ncbi:hypothetical protein [Pedobacter frigiditerrae]|uniref:hypothetical protein n=1 Tax=Pedobacter frigiditerrae TaxID=2530452 RepID=UPI002931218D|nr:hypothetical protein [Pedobacter frigiditerrae]
MIHLSKKTSKNKFGYNTYEVRFTPILYLQFIEANYNTYIVEFSERGIIFPSLRFTFTKSADIKVIITLAMQKIIEYFRASKSQGIDENYFNRAGIELLERADFMLPFNK